MRHRAPSARLIAELLARCTFPAAGTEVDCAFSGGADSTALVVLARAAGCVVTAWHVEHGLHSRSGEAAAAAEALAGRLGVSVRTRSVVVSPGANLEARARAARRAALPDGVLTGHTADDRAETMLINLLRGAGPAGLAAMGPAPTRPLLALRRSETHALCAAAGLVVVEDPTNADDRFVRNRVRHELLPLMDAIAGRAVAPLLVRTAELIDTELVERDDPGVDPTDAVALGAASGTIGRRAVRHWLAIDGYPPDRATVERVLAVARGECRACQITGGRRVERHRQRLRIVEPGELRSPVGMHHPLGMRDHPGVPREDGD